MKKGKLLKFVNRYKVALGIAFGFSLIGYLNPVEYKAEYEAKAATIEKLSNEIVNMKETDSLDEITKEAEDIESKNNELKNLLEEKKLEIERVKEEERKEGEKKEEERKAAEEAKKKADEEMKRVDEEKKNNSGTIGKPVTPQKPAPQQEKPVTPAPQPQKPAPQKPATPTPQPQKPVAPPQNQGNMVYANGGSSTSNKYHSTPTAHKMEGAIKMSENDAKAKGYVACQKCY